MLAEDLQDPMVVPVSPQSITNQKMTRRRLGVELQYPDDPFSLQRQVVARKMVAADNFYSYINYTVNTLLCMIAVKFVVELRRSPPLAMGNSILLFILLLYTVSHCFQNMVVIPSNSSKVIPEGPSLQFSIHDTDDSLLLGYAADPPANLILQSTSVDLFIASKSEAALPIKSIKVNRADSGAVIKFFVMPGDNEPAFSLSFGMSIIEPVVLNLGEGLANVSAGNAHLIVGDRCKAGKPISRITLSYPQPQFLIL